MSGAGWLGADYYQVCSKLFSYSWYSLRKQEWYLLSPQEFRGWQGLLLWATLPHQLFPDLSFLRSFQSAFASVRNRSAVHFLWQFCSRARKTLKTHFHFWTCIVPSKTKITLSLLTAQSEGLKKCQTTLNWWGGWNSPPPRPCVKSPDPRTIQPL